MDYGGLIPRKGSILLKTASFNKPHSRLSLELIGGEEFSVEDAINKAGYGAFQTRLVTISCFAWVAFNLDFNSNIAYLASCALDMETYHIMRLRQVKMVCRGIGCIFFGVLADKYGRREILAAASIFAFVLCTVSAHLPTYTWYGIFQAAKSFSLGGLPQAITICCEYLPGNFRGRLLFVMCGFWLFGKIMLHVTVYSTIQTENQSNWRFLTISTAFPAGVVAFMLRWFPESLRFLLVSGKDVAADAVLKEIFAENKVVEPRGRLHPAVDSAERGNLRRMFSHSHRKAILILMFIAFMYTMTYFLVVALSQKVTSSKGGREFGKKNSTRIMSGKFEQRFCTVTIESDQILNRVWFDVLNLPGYLVLLLFVDLVDRKKLLCGSCSLCFLCLLLFFSKTKSSLMGIVYFSARTLVAALYGVILLVASEQFPTTLRGTAVGLVTSCVCFGMLAYVLLVTKWMIKSLGWDFMKGLACFNMLLCAISSIFITRETKGVAFMET